MEKEESKSQSVKRVRILSPPSSPLHDPPPFSWLLSNDPPSSSWPPLNDPPSSSGPPFSSGNVSSAAAEASGPVSDLGGLVDFGIENSTLPDRPFDWRDVSHVRVDDRTNKVYVLAALGDVDEWEGEVYVRLDVAKYFESEALLLPALRKQEESEARNAPVVKGDSSSDSKPTKGDLSPLQQKLNTILKSSRNAIESSRDRIRQWCREWTDALRKLMRAHQRWLEVVAEGGSASLDDLTSEIDAKEKEMDAAEALGDFGLAAALSKTLLQLDKRFGLERSQKTAITYAEVLASTDESLRDALVYGAAAWELYMNNVGIAKLYKKKYHKTDDES